MRTPIMAGNWKMHFTTQQAVDLAAAIGRAVGNHPPGVGAATVEVIVAPPFTALPAVARALQGSAVAVGAQDMHWAREGAFTGEVSPPMVAEYARWVIIGHSERRALFAESDDDVQRKTHAACDTDLLPIVCVGESESQRDAGAADTVVTGQLVAALDGLAASEVAALAVAYEPVWAIGTGRACDPAEARRMAALLRESARGAFGGAAELMRILYGGSVTPANATEYLSADDIDGALVGGAALTADSFTALVQIAVAARSPDRVGP